MFPTVGRLNFTDNLIDPSTGAIRSRAEFANPDGVLLPGQFVRVYLKGGKLKNAMLIPQRAVLSTQQGKLVFVANAQNKAEPRPVELGDEVKNEVIVVRGLQAGDRVIVDGNIKARPGAPVKVVDPTAAGKPAAAPAKGRKSCSRLSLSAGRFFACVISIIILLAGFAAMRALSVEQYPQIVPPQVQVTAIYWCVGRGDRPDRGRAAGAADQRCGQYALHQFGQRASNGSWR